MNGNMNIRNRLFEKISFEIFGILGSIIILLAFFIPALVYRGLDGRTFSMFNYFVSELGYVGVSELSWFFNLGLIIGGMLLVLFMWGVGGVIQQRLAKVASIIGIISAVFTILIGVFPMNNLVPHALVAIGFFLAGMIAIVLFSFAIFRDTDKRFPKSFVLFGIFIVLSFFVFLFVPLDSSDINFSEIPVMNGFLDIDTYRPNIWVNAIFEWISVLSITFWILIVSVYLRIRE